MSGDAFRNGHPGPDRCPFEDEVLVLADGVLDPPRRLVVEAHLGVCDACAALDDMLDRAAASLRAAPAPRFDATERALARIEARRPPRLVVATAAAAAVVASWLLLDGDGVRRLPARRDSGVAGRDAVSGASQARPEQTAASPRTKPDLAAGAAHTSPPLQFPPAPPLDGVRADVAALDPRAGEDDPALAAVVRRLRNAGAAGTQALVDLLACGDRDVAARALRVSAALRSTSCIRALGGLLEDERLAAEAARQLGELGTPAAVAHLAEALEGPAREDALAALVAAGSDRSVGALEERLRDGDPDPRTLLDAAVVLAPRRAAKLLLDTAASEPAAAEAVLREHSAALVDPLADLSRSADPLVAAAAVRALGATGDPAAIAPLVAASSRPSLARRAADGLVAIGTRAAFDAAFDVATSPRAPRGVLSAFDGAPDAVPTLAAAVGDPRAARRESAVEALGRTESEDAVPALAPCLDDPHLRRPAIEALARIGGDAAADALAAHAARGAPDGRLVAALGATRSPRAVASLRAFGEQPSHSAEVAAALAGIATTESVVALVELYALPRSAREAGDALRTLPAGLVVPTLLDRLDDPLLGTRAHRALVLVAGRDLGPGTERWSAWWDRRAASDRPPRKDRP